MSLNDLIKRTCCALGQNNKPTYVVMAIAAVKGICRPVFTMMDKTENSETKKYTALREGLTEAIAIPSYWACGELSAKLAPKIFKDKALVKRAETNLMFIGVCAAAVFVIPALCSAVIKPVMNKIGLKQTAEQKKEPLKKEEPVKNPVINPVMAGKNPTPYSFKAFSTNFYSGMKVGGI